MSKRPRPASSGGRKKPPHPDKGAAPAKGSGAGRGADSSDDAGVWSTNPDPEAGDGSSRGAKRAATGRGSAPPFRDPAPGAGSGAVKGAATGRGSGAVKGAATGRGSGAVKGAATGRGSGAVKGAATGRGSGAVKGAATGRGSGAVKGAGGAPSPRRSVDSGRPPGPVRPGSAAGRTPAPRGGLAPSEGIVATLDKRGRFLVAEPFFERGGRMIVERDPRYSVGDLVFVRPASRSGGHAKILRQLGRPDVAGDVLEALMLDRGLRRRFDPAVERAAKKARDAGPDVTVARRDLTKLTTFTIDPATARDFDDAISAEAIDGGGTRIWVHIADVSAFVTAGSLVDREAARRATSVYVPGRVEPMLPEALSNDACSLVPGLERAAVTVEIDFDGPQVRRASFYRSTIRSDARLDYEQVDRIFDGIESAQEPWATPLAAARAVSAALHERRMAQAALELETSEPEFRFDVGGHVAEARPSEQTESHRLIEHLMIASNEQVAKLLSDRGVPTLYRVHEPPDGSSALRLVEQLASLGVPTPPTSEHMTPTEAADVVAACSRFVAQHVARTGRGRDALTFLILRSLKQAYYSPKGLGHAGLGLTHYCHFTSPIRRYPDLVAHRALLSAVAGEEEPPRGADMEETGTWSSAREREAMQIERLADRVARAFVLERELFEQGWDREFDGEVTGLIGAGAFVRFGGGHEGMLPLRSLRGDWWELNDESTILRGEHTGQTLRLGDPVRVIVDRVDTARGRVDLVPVDAPDA
ncbi:MAG TPA: RNB domain-containing ribonuclease [Solirubrobacteraceae bacterium]|nr:RNB domain-containing ribonuclease [Solirubrobacteraceae bacterium]